VDRQREKPVPRFDPADDGVAPAAGDEDEKQVNFGWKDIIALTIAAYEVILPIVLLFIGGLALVYLLLRLAH